MGRGAGVVEGGGGALGQISPGEYGQKLSESEGAEGDHKLPCSYFRVHAPPHKIVSRSLREQPWERVCLPQRILPLLCIPSRYFYRLLHER